MSGPCGGRLRASWPTAAPCTEMAAHLFLTGVKGVGKSTLLQALLAKRSGPVGGFRTVKTQAVFPGRPSVHLLRAALNEQPTLENFLFFCGERWDQEIAARFDRLGCAALAPCQGTALLLMDELGPHEAQAARFQQAVLDALDGDLPIWGVLQVADSLFLRRIAAHPQVNLYTVTPENRDTLASTLPGQWAIE